MSSTAAYSGPTKVIVTLSPTHAAALVAAGQAAGRKPSELASALLAAALESVKDAEPSPWRRRPPQRGL